MAETTWDAEIAAISAWAASYYPSKASSPPVAMTTRRFTLDDIVALFAATTSLKHHLALVVNPPSGAGWRDQEPPQSHIKPASTRGTAYNHDRFGSGRPVTDQAAHAMATEKPRPIVTYVHRPKRQPRKKAQATVITGPTI